jgi:HSP20 family protein
MTSIINELLNIDRAYQDTTNLVKSSDDVYTVEFELAGFSKKDVKITVCDEVLTIEAEKSGKKKKTHKVYLKNLVSLDGISSKMSDGLLTITMPKKEVKKTLTINVD